MQTLVIYHSKFGNTERIATAIARGARSVSDVQLLSTADASRAIGTLATPPDLVLVGGPTHNHGPSAGLKALIEALPEPLRHTRAAAFDTRYRGPAVLMGSAAGSAAKGLAKAGAEVVVPPESFFILRQGPMPLQVLETGEVERAEAWGHAIAVATAARRDGGAL